MVSLFHSFKPLHAQLQQEELKEYNVRRKEGRKKYRAGIDIRLLGTWAASYHTFVLLGY